MIKEFKEFAMRGNVMDLAIGVILGGAFGKIVSSFVADILMPPIGLVLGKVDFSNLYLNLDGGSFASLAEAKKAGAATLNYGFFLNQVIDFTIVAFAIFLVIKALNRMKTAEAAVPATVKDCRFCLSSIPLGATRCPHCTSELKASA
jgi:large conductance mechanosensitive channel